MLRTLAIVFALVTGLAALPARAIVLLDDWEFLVDGDLFYDVSLGSAPLPSLVDDSNFDYFMGYGTVTMTITGVGNHVAGMLVDHEIDEAGNSFFQENAVAVGTPGAGQSWEIDEPGFGVGTYVGDIYDNFGDMPPVLDNMAFVSVIGGSLSDPDDPSMAMLFDFTLAPDEVARVVFRLAPSAQAGDFHLHQTDAQSTDQIFFSATLDISAAAVPAPGTLLLIAGGIAGLAFAGRRRG